MPAQLPDYEYDIFISYRQNDNKAAGGSGEGWVTDFVNNLTDELESVVKGRVSVYFDKNPTHGLLETHNVDASLSGKLKSLILIPIVSQTYCDPTSFAWKEEFLPFLKQASSDKFGLTVKLLSGNAANRVLPIRIHELEPADVKLIEAELNSKLRPVDFIFKVAGVNRPLRSNEEDPLKNAHHTLYRDQINKTANAIKDIINGLKNSEKGPPPEKLKTTVTAFPKIQGGPKTIAVLPFISVDDQDEYFGDGLAEQLHMMLSNIKGLKLAPWTHSSQYRGKIAPHAVSEDLGVGTVLAGSVKKNGVQLKLNLNASSSDGLPVWSEQYDVAAGELISALKKTSHSIAGKFNVSFRENERNLIDKTPDASFAVLDLYFQGRYYLHRTGDELKKSLTCFQEAAKLDPHFAPAHAGIAHAFILSGYNSPVSFREAVNLARMEAVQALNIDPGLVDAYHVLALISLCYEWSWPEAEHYFNNIFSINAANPAAGERYKQGFHQIISHLERVQTEPLITIPYFLPAYALIHRGEFEKGLVEARKAVEKDSNSFMAHRAMGLCYLGLEKYSPAIESLQKAANLSNRHSWLLFELMGAYTMSGQHDEAKGIMEEALAQSNALPSKIHNFFFPSFSR